MSQARNKLGIEFEKQVCLQKNLEKFSKRPSIKWSGIGKNVYEKIASVNFNVDKFYTLSATFEKCDATDSDNNKIEIKRYLLKDISRWKLYSEPFPSLKDGDYLKYIELFGNGSFERGKQIYNTFIIDLMNKNSNYLNYITKEMYSSNIGIQLIDAFIPNSDLEFKTDLTAWKGIKRIRIQFRKKGNAIIKTHPPIQIPNAPITSAPITLITNSPIQPNNNSAQNNLFSKAKKYAKNDKEFNKLLRVLERLA